MAPVVSNPTSRTASASRPPRDAGSILPLVLVMSIVIAVVIAIVVVIIQFSYTQTNTVRTPLSLLF